MRKLKEEELKNIKKQLGGDVDVFESPSSDASDRNEAVADARVPSLDALRGRSSGSATSPESDAVSAVAMKKKDKSDKRHGNPGKSDYSVRFKGKNADSGSKVAIVSSKLKKVVYEQG